MTKLDWEMVPVDEATGLPELPEDYFWRVRHTRNNEYDLNGYIHVSLMKNLPPKWYKKNRVEFIHYKKFDLDDRDREYQTCRYKTHMIVDPDKYEQIVFRLAAVVLEERKDQLEAAELNHRAKAELKRITGDYPPKSINYKEEGN